MFFERFSGRREKRKAQNQGPSITIRQRDSGSPGIELRSAAFGTQKWAFRKKNKIPRQVRRYNKDLDRIAEEYWQAARQFHADKSSEAKRERTQIQFLRKLEELGIGFVNRALLPRKGGLHAYDDLCRYFSEAYARLTEGGREPLRIEILIDFEDFAPFEFLPMIGVEQRIDAEASSLKEAAGRFLNYSAVVTRQRLAHRGLRDFSEARVSAAATLPVNFFWRRQFPGAQQEGEYLGRRKDLEVRGPLPETVSDWSSPEAVERSIARFLLNSSAPQFFETLKNRLFWQDWSGPGVIYHFACHTWRGEGLESLGWQAHGDTLSMTDVSGKEIRLGVQTLVNQVDRTALPAKPPNVLMFLNTCSAIRGEDGDERFSELLLDNYCARCLVGPMTVVHDLEAAEFSIRFYKNLLRGEHPVGEAVRRTRWRLLTDLASLSGLFYITYGDPMLQIVTAKQGFKEVS